MSVSLRVLPAPDRVEWGPPEDGVFLICGDRETLIFSLATRLVEVGWRVVVVHPSTAQAVAEDMFSPPNLPVVVLASDTEAEVQATLSEVTRVYGSISAFVYVSPHEDAVCDPFMLDPGCVASLRLPFLLAKHLQPALTEAAREHRACFVTVTRTDGVLGTAGESGSNPMVGGLAGLTKTLRLEWPEVFCRAIDLGPALDDFRAVELLLTELHDPNRLLAEVGVGSEARVTLEARTPIGALRQTEEVACV
ncbi:MAG: hypothetical protein ACP5HS_00515 [Anaerolineae bacterium]